MKVSSAGSWARHLTKAGQSWITTFADLAALLLTFFVMVFSMAHLEPLELAKGADKTQSFHGPTADSALEQSNIDAIASPDAVNDRYLEAWLIDQSQSHPFFATLESYPVRKGIGFTIASPLGSFSNLRDEMQAIGPVLEALQRQINIETELKVQGPDSELLFEWAGGLARMPGIKRAANRIAVQTISSLSDPRLVLEIRR